MAMPRPEGKAFKLAVKVIPGLDSKSKQRENSFVRTSSPEEKVIYANKTDVKHLEKFR